MPSKPIWTSAPILGVRNVRQATEYYRDALGFNLDPETGVFEGFGEGRGGVYAIVERNGAEIHFQIRRGDLPERKRESIERDVYIHVDDVDAVYADLQKRGAANVSAPKLAFYGLREIEVVDPNGFRLAFGAPA